MKANPLILPRHALLPVLGLCALSWVPFRADATEYFFGNGAPIALLDQTNASPYPSTIDVGQVLGVVAKVTVTLTNLSHPYPQDLKFLLMGPGSNGVVLLANAGNSPGGAATNVTLTFDDFAPVAPRQYGQLTSGTFQTGAYPPVPSFPPPAPGGIDGTNLGVFLGTNPNGTWQLFALDSIAGGAGSLAGWGLTITTHFQVFTDSGGIVISNSAALGTPYPATISVGKVTSPITKITVTLNGLTHSYPSDLDVLLEAPSGDSVVLMSDAGGGFGVTNLTLTFDDDADGVPSLAGPLQSGVFQPSNFPGTDPFLPPAPSTNYASALSILKGQSAIGLWKLYVVDDYSGADGGMIQSWQLAICTEPLAITRQPAGILVPVGNSGLPVSTSATFSVSVAGIDPISYQWLRNGQLIPGGTSSALVLPKVGLSDGGNYSVLVANPAGAVESERVPLQFGYPLSAAGDSFADRTPLIGFSGIVMATNFFASKEPGEPRHAYRPGGSSIWFNWVPNASGIGSFNTRGSTFDTLLGIYSGNSLTNLQLVAQNDDSGGGLTSSAIFSAQANRLYAIAVDGARAKQGTCILTWSLEQTADVIPTTSIPPLSVTVPEGSDAPFSVWMWPPEGLVYQWYLAGTPIAGATSNAFTVVHAQRADLGQYTVVATTAAGRSITNEPAELQFGTDPTLQFVPKEDDIFAPVIPLPAFASRRHPLVTLTGTNDYAGSGFSSVSAGLGFRQSFSAAGGTVSMGTGPCTFVVASAKKAQLAPTESGEFIIDTAGSDVPTLLAIYTNNAVDVPELMSCAMSPPSITDPVQVTFWATAGKAYTVVAAAQTYSAISHVVEIGIQFGVPLSISLTAANQVTLTWRAQPTLYQLQTAPGLAGTWSIVPTEQINYANGTNRATLPVADSAQFFRLKKP